MTFPNLCEHIVFAGFCGKPATHRGITSGQPLCEDHAKQRERNGTEPVWCEVVAIRHIKKP